MLIECQDLTLAYEGRKIIQNLSFTVKQGDYLSIIGENGSGKTTLIKGLLGLKSPADGKINYHDLLANQIGYLPQQTDIQKDFPASVFEVVLSGRLSQRGLKPFYSKKDKEIASEQLERLNISHLKNICYRELSGGQQQRVRLARALCATSKILLLDEPVSGLDPLVTNELYQLIDRINNELNITIIMVSHDVTQTFKYSTHILHLKDKTYFFGTTDEYKQSDYKDYLTGGQHYD